MANATPFFVDRSVDTGDIPDTWTDEQIRRAIRFVARSDRGRSRPGEVLRPVSQGLNIQDSTVTVVLVGPATRRRKHVDWEIHSSMYDGTVNKRSGIVVINLPGISNFFDAPYGAEEKQLLYPDIASWTTINQRAEYERRYPYMPSRIIDNLMKSDVTISVVPWIRINGRTLQFLIEAAFRNRANCRYDLSQPMRRANS